MAPDTQNGLSFLTSVHTIICSNTRSSAESEPCSPLFQTHRQEKQFENEVERRERRAEDRKRELRELREKLSSGNKESVLDQFGDLLNSSANKIKKTKVCGTFYHLRVERRL